MSAPSRFRFFVTALRHPGRIGAVLPSSRALAERMTGGLELRSGDAVLELGPGTGALTDCLAVRLPKDATYLGVELEESFVRLLAERHPTLRVAHGSATDLQAHVADAGIDPNTIRAVLCSLPFAQFGPRLQDELITSMYRIMPAGAVLRIYQYVYSYPMPLARRFRARMSARFGPYEVSRLVVPNVPPAFVVSWTRPQDDAADAHVERIEPTESVRAAS